MYNYYKMKYTILSILLLQGTVYTLVLKLSHSYSPYFHSVLILIAELVKLFVSVSLSSISIRNLLNYETLIPSLLYFISNSLLYKASMNLEPAIFQILSQFKLFSTAVFSIWILGKKFSHAQWLSLLGLILGMWIVQYSMTQDSTLRVDGLEKNLFQFSFSCLNLILASTLSSFASVL